MRLSFTSCRPYRLKLSWCNVEIRDVDPQQNPSEAYRTNAAPPEEVQGIPFSNNPHPMWIYDLQTLSFLAVNQAAIRVYGYSEAEFLNMTVLDIRREKDVPRFLESWKHPHESTGEQWLHTGKDGIPFAVSITSWELAFQGRKAELVLAREDGAHSAEFDTSE